MRLARLLVFGTVLASAMLAGCGTPGPDGPIETYGVDFTPPPMDASPRGAIVFVVDGINAETFQQMLAAGELPGLQRFFVDRGLYAPRAVANIPSVTLANLSSIASGKYPGHMNIPGINWYSRADRFWRNYETIAQKNTLDGDHRTPLVYDAFPDDLTVSVFFQPHRGATKFYENWTSAGPPFFFGWYEFVDRLTLFRLRQMMDLSRQAGQFPKLVIAYLLAPDFMAYKYGASSEEYRHSIRHADRQITRVLNDLDRAGLLDRIHIAMVTDHSHSDVHTHLQIDPLLRDWGLTVSMKKLWDTELRSRIAYYRQFQAVTYGSGDRYWAICLRKPAYDAAGAPAGYAPWPGRPSAAELASYPLPNGSRIDLLGKLAALEGVDAVTYAPAANTVRVRTKTGEVEFTQPDGRGGAIGYRTTAGADALGYEAVLSADELTPADPDAWLARTLRTDYPDLPAQILAYFRADRAGDIALFAEPGYDFRTQHKGGHGGLRGREDMLVPFLLAGPGVPHGTIDQARSVDLVPTILTLLGKPIPPDLDGKSLIK